MGEGDFSLVFCCDAGTAASDGCEASAVALAGHAVGALAGTLVGKAKVA